MGGLDTAVRGHLKNALHWLLRNQNWHADVNSWMQTQTGKDETAKLIAAYHTSYYLGWMTVGEIPGLEPPAAEDEGVSKILERVERRQKILECVKPIRMPEDTYFARAVPMFMSRANLQPTDVAKATTIFKEFLDASVQMRFVHRFDGDVQLSYLGVQAYASCLDNMKRLGRN